MAPHTWSHLGDTVSDATHHMYCRGQRIKEAYYRGECVWRENPPRRINIVGLHQIPTTSSFPYFQHGEFDTYVSKILIPAAIPYRVIYEYGLKGEELKTEVVKIDSPSKQRLLYHVVQTPQKLPIERYHYELDSGKFLMKKE